MSTQIKNGKVYVVISGKGGVGKTTSTINLGSYINDLGKEVIIVDANLTTPNIGLHLGSPIVPITLNHVMDGKAKVEEAIYEHESGTKILPSSLSIAELKNIDHDKLSNVVKRLRRIADHIFLDSSAGLGEEAKSAIKACDEVIIITNPEISAVTDALKTAKVAEEMDKKVLGVIITRCEGASWEMPIETIKDMLEIPILGVIPEDASVKESQKMKNPVVHTHPKSKSARAYKKVARRILGPEYVKKAEELDKKAEGFFKKFMRKLGF
jgi:septum site-determining protein MinD